MLSGGRIGEYAVACRGKMCYAVAGGLPPDNFALEGSMEPTNHTVLSINGDYAYLRSDSGVDNQVAMFLLPEGVDVGSRLLWENFEWTLL